jgi:hypothetical protein
VVWHWSLASTDVFDKNVTWKNDGAVLNASHVQGAFDASGVFTPGAVRECKNESSCNWYLFFGGVANQDPSHSENVGVAIATSPWGPFERWHGNPVFSFHDPNSAWCHGEAARVDEIKPSLIEDQKLLVVKSVCTNGTALPVVYEPVDGLSWGPPYRVRALPDGDIAPLFLANKTCKNLGFEEPTIYLASDGYLHFHGHDHGGCSSGSYTHFISPKRLLHDNWYLAHPFVPGEAIEPVPIPVSGDGVFGGAMMDKWIDFPNFELAFLNVTWLWTNSTTQV